MSEAVSRSVIQSWPWVDLKESLFLRLLFLFKINTIQPFTWNIAVMSGMVVLITDWICGVIT